MANEENIIVLIDEHSFTAVSKKVENNFLKTPFPLD